MSLKVTKEIAIPAGKHRGIITGADETTKVFDPQRGPEGVVEFTIQPSFKKEGYQTRAISFTVSPSGSTLGAFAKLMARLGHPIDDLPEADPKVAIGTEVEFEAVVKDDFVNIKKESVRAVAK